VTGYGTDKIALRTQSKSPGYLVLSEVFYPGWTATVDGRRGDIQLGNYLFRVVPLEKGEHEVVLTFVSRSFWVGGAISLVTLMTVAGALWVLRRRGRVTED
jgi:uncharacterized membrane protein YfhO